VYLISAKAVVQIYLSSLILVFLQRSIITSYMQKIIIKDIRQARAIFILDATEGFKLKGVVQQMKFFGFDSIFLTGKCLAIFLKSSNMGELAKYLKANVIICYATSQIDLNFFVQKVDTIFFEFFIFGYFEKIFISHSRMNSLYTVGNTPNNILLKVKLGIYPLRRFLFWV
jgi:hypothetical protein